MKCRYTKSAIDCARPLSASACSIPRKTCRRAEPDRRRWRCGRLPGRAAAREGFTGRAPRRRTRGLARRSRTLRQRAAGRTLQFDGHLDTVHLPFVPPQVVDGQLTGSGASDMKGGLAAAVEALYVLRDTGSCRPARFSGRARSARGPWGLGQQLNALSLPASTAMPC